MSYRILITEDDKVTAMLLRKMVEQLSHIPVGIATTGTEALQKVEEGRPDLVLMDISLPGVVDGIAATNQIIDKYSLPVVYVTGMTDADTLNRVLSSHPFGYIPKPVKPDVLHTVVELAVQRHRLEQQLIRNKDELKILNSQLESKIEERTIELKRRNEDLKEEVTKRKRSEAQLKISLAKERELNELKSRIVSIISHEIKTPLTSVKSSAELIGMYLDGEMNPENIDKHIKRINSSVESLSNLVNDTLFISKIESGKLEPKVEPILIIDEIQRIIDQVSNGYSKNHTIAFEVEKGFPDTIQSDARLLNHICTNLISNAVKYSPDTELVEVALNRDDYGMHIQIKDYGLGIPEKDKKYLFEMFHRASNTMNIGGTGLGLAIVKRSVEQLGGQLSFESEENMGTTFDVQIPLREFEG